MGELRDEVKELKRQLDQLKSSITPAPHHPAEAARWADEVHQRRERRATAAARVGFSKADLAAMQQACPDATMRSIVSDNRAPQGPHSVLPSTAQDVPRGVAGSGSGWAHVPELSNPPGTNWADKLMDAQDRRDLEDRLVEEAKRLAALKAAEKL